MQDNEYNGYPPELIAHLQQIINERNVQMHSNFINISVDNLPVIISGFGYKICEQALCALMLAVKNHFVNMSYPPLIMRLQKEQIAIYFFNQPNKIDNFVLQELLKLIKIFQFQSECGIIHILSSISNVELLGDEMSALDLLNDSYLQLKSNRYDLYHNLLLNVHDANESRADMNMLSHINNAIKSGQLCMAFQPIICSKTGNAVHYEALLRVKKPNGELTTAGPLIPVAERMGLIGIIDEMVLEMIVAELLENEHLNISFNVSNLTANSNEWLANFEKIAHKYPQIIPRMMIEITETAVHLNLNKTAYFVASLQAQGAKVALDDFGSGYTSFRQLKSLSVDMIKIDGMFVQDLVTNSDSKLFMKTMLDFTKGFGLETVAECVEDGETAKFLMQLGVDYMQGYYFGYPKIKSYNDIPFKHIA